jgi:Protein of unknown function (DUF2891)
VQSATSLVAMNTSASGASARRLSLMDEINQRHASFARKALEHVRQEFPNFLMHLASDAGTCADVRPKALHPVFFGSYDWHSCVHMHWSLARLMNLYGSASEAKAIASWFDRQFTANAIAGELAYFEDANHRFWERPYGWAWLLKLYAELAVCAHPHAPAWRLSLQPLVDYLSDSMFEHLKTTPAPVRHGVHSNTAFAMIHALRYATTTGDHEFIDLIHQRARDFFANDVDYRMAYDYSAEDFLSPALTEALLMSIVLPKIEFRHWFDDFLPDLKSGHYEDFGPSIVANETDAKLVHNHGLNLSRAWCLRGLMQSLDLHDPRWQRFGELSAESERAAQAAIVDGDYVSTHWLISFALLAETEWRR